MVALTAMDKFSSGSASEQRRKALGRSRSSVGIGLLTNEIVKRDLIDSEEAKAAFQNVKRLQRTAARKKSSEKELEEKPTVAPAEDASGYLPRAAVTEPVGKLNLS
jgi:hypothetical protein